MKLRIYQVDTFTDKLFSGNPAAVCPIPNNWLADQLMQNIALENNLAETAFYVPDKTGYHIRWFTPSVEVDLCGHATLAAAFVLFHYENYKNDEIHFYSRSGLLKIKKENDYLTMDFPTDTIEEVDPTAEILACFNITPVKVVKGKTDYMLIFENEEQIQNIQFDLNKISRIKARGIIITAAGNNSDFVSRFFAPQSGINEDPVTGSAHTTLTPYWSRILDKKELTAVQLSRRKGFLLCRNKDDRTEISGKAQLYMQGVLTLMMH